MVRFKAGMRIGELCALTIYIPVWFDLKTKKERLKMNSDNLHSSMVRFKVSKALLVLVFIGLFTFQYGSI